MKNKEKKNENLIKHSSSSASTSTSASSAVTLQQKQTEKTFLQQLVDPNYHLQNPSIIISSAILLTAIIFVRMNQNS